MPSNRCAPPSNRWKKTWRTRKRASRRRSTPVPARHRKHPTVMHPRLMHPRLMHPRRTHPRLTHPRVTSPKHLSITSPKHPRVTLPPARSRQPRSTAPVRTPRRPRRPVQRRRSTGRKRKRAEPERPMQDTVNREGHDEIEASKAPLMEHLIELRQRLIYTLVGIGIGFFICFAFATNIYNLLVWPYQVARGEGQKIEMIYTAPHEFFFTKLKLALFGAIFLAFPLIAYQIYKFVAPGLYKNERDAFRPYLLWTFILFILGAMVVYFVVMPLAMKFFLSMEQTGGQVEIHLQARVSEYLSLIMTLILGFGIMFQLPVVLTLLAQAGIIGADNLRAFRRYAIVAITAAAGILSPPDPFSMVAMALPTVLLYEAAIYAVARVEKGRLAKEAAAAQTPAA